MTTAVLGNASRGVWPHTMGDKGSRTDPPPNTVDAVAPVVIGASPRVGAASVAAIDSYYTMGQGT